MPHFILAAFCAVSIIFITGNFLIKDITSNDLSDIISLRGIIILFLIMVAYIIFNPLSWILSVALIEAFLCSRLTELVITDRRVVAQRRRIKRSDSIEIIIPKIESVQVNQPFWGRIFNYGTIVISGAGNPQAPIPGIKDPFEFRRSLVDLMDQCQKK